MQSKDRIIGIDIGGTNFRIGAVDKEGNITMFRKIPVRSVFQSGQPLVDLGEYLKTYIRELKEETLRIAAISRRRSERYLHRGQTGKMCGGSRLLRI